MMPNPEDGQNPEESFPLFAFPAADEPHPAISGGNRRLDALLPQDAETGAVTPEALRDYLNAVMEMADRYGQPLALLAVAVDTAEETQSVLRRFGAEGARLIGRAVARCLHQETRLHDVVGRAKASNLYELPIFLVVCPLRGEAQAARLAERMREAMTAYAADPDCPWLTVSVGVAAMAIDKPDPEALIARAAEALHRARQVPGGCVWRHADTLRRLCAENEPERPEGQDDSNSTV